MKSTKEIVQTYKTAERYKTFPFAEWHRKDVFEKLIRDFLLTLGYNPDHINYDDTNGIAELKICEDLKAVVYISSIQEEQRFLSNKISAPIDTIPDPETGKPEYEIAVVTNFEKWFFYFDGREIYAISGEKLEEEYDTIKSLISKDAIESGKFKEVARSLLHKEDNEPLRQELNILREKIAGKILQERTNVQYLKNPDGSYNNEILNEITTRWITRFLALKLAEDSGISFNFTLRDIRRSFESQGKTAKPLASAKVKEETLSNAIRALMNEFERRYNGGIFMYEEGVDYITIPDSTFFDLLDFTTGWAFTIEDARIIGFVYERFLGQEIVIEERKGGLEAVLKNIGEARGRRKAGGIYYTPKYIVDYIVENTLGEILKEKRKGIENAVKNIDCEKFISVLREVRSLKVLDPACGSGSFLIKVFAELKNFYDEVKGKAKEIRREIDGLRRERIKGQMLFIEDKEVLESEEKYSDLQKEINEIKFSGTFALRSNIYGVDLDPKAIDITAFTLMVQVYDELKEGARCPTMIGENLKIGNSLVSAITPDEREGFISRVKLERFKDEIDEIIRLREIEKSVDVIDEQKLRNLIKKDFEDVVDVYLRIKEKYPNAIHTSQQKLLDEWYKRAKKEQLEKTYDILINQTGLARVFLKEVYFEKIEKLKERIENEIDKPLIRYFNSQNKVLKDKEFEEILKDREKAKEELRFIEDRAVEISKSQPPKVFNWEIEFPEVFFDDGSLKENPGFDCVVGNPPYGDLLEDRTLEYANAIFKTYIGEIAGIFVEKGINMTKNGGFYGNLITFAITYHLSLSSLRKMMKYNFEEIRIATFDRDPVGIFEKKSMSQSVSILICQNKRKNVDGKMFTTSFIRTTQEIKDNIIDFLKNLQFEDTEGLLLGEKIGSPIDIKHRPPKIGDSIARGILEKLKSFPETIKSFYSDQGVKLYIRTSGNYWYNAFDRKPYESSEIKLIGVRDIFARDFIILILNSSLFYFYGRIYNDGRHMQKEFLKTFPIPSREVLEKYKDRISEAKEKIMAALFSHFQPQQRRFETSKCKKVIDELDSLLAKIYNLSEEELKYIINYDDCIRNKGLKEEPEVKEGDEEDKN
ncbi:BREX-1 system adenine-specific DNA-methyltransferase PglX [Dehalococcoidia bacterium]|nr:BREX-1 system adenine-specific DNA-methyltransferase PglX [Dehalococcoidia bacterium]